MYFSVYCRTLCLCLGGVDILFHPLMIYMLLGISVSQSDLELILFIIQAANIFLTIKRIIGRNKEVLYKKE